MRRAFAEQATREADEWLSEARLHREEALAYVLDVVTLRSAESHGHRA